MSQFFAPLRSGICRCYTGFTTTTTAQQLLPAATATTPQLVVVRGKKKAAAMAVKKQGGNKRKKGSHPGPKVLIDQFVQPSQILFRQKNKGQCRFHDCVHKELVANSEFH